MIPRSRGGNAAFENGQTTLLVVQRLERCQGLPGEPAARLRRHVAPGVVGASMSAAAEQSSTHADPVWRERANFIINAPLPEAGRSEQLWTKKVGGSQLETCCIPFVLYDLALGDTVATAPQGGRQIRPESGVAQVWAYVFRCYFERPVPLSRRGGQAVEAFGVQIEWPSPSLLAIDVVGASAQAVAEVLHGLEQQERLVYETGKTA